MGRSVGIEVNIYRQEPMAYREAWSEKLNFFFFFVSSWGLFLPSIPRKWFYGLCHSFWNSCQLDKEPFHLKLPGSRLNLMDF